MDALLLEHLVPSTPARGFPEEEGVPDTHTHAHSSSAAVAGTPLQGHFWMCLDSYREVTAGLGWHIS